MNNKRDGAGSRQTLRSDAEKMVVSLSPDEMTALPAAILLHELLVHKIELEMQNEELQSAQATLEEARDHYLDLYEFAPVGYMTITRDSMVSEINLTGATMLGIDRTKLLQRRFSHFVADQDKDRWHRLFMHMMTTTQDEKKAVDMHLLYQDGSAFYAHLDCLRNSRLEALPTLRVIITAISPTPPGGN